MESRSFGPDSANPIADGVILWRFSTAGRCDLWGMVFELRDGFHFVVDDDPKGPRPYLIHERYPDLAGLMSRADDLKSSLGRCGWQEVDVG
jgi:hypothetical protein